MQEATVRSSSSYSNPATWAAIALLTVAGFWCLRAQIEILAYIWTHDSLRSIGMLIPIASLVLAWRAWTAEDWRGGGTWWGLALVIAALSAAWVTGANSSALSFWRGGRLIEVSVLPIGAMFYAYVSGMVLLFGGMRAWRKAAFALALWLFVNPVPPLFAAFDLPLQRLGAEVARAFAALLQVSVSSGTLQMMFSPHLGMFIAPGCDGMRGAVTLGYLALIGGHLYRMPALRHLFYVAGAVLLAYAFNLVRLCAVVIYYWAALRYPSLGAWAEQADYLIGGVLFLGAAVFILTLPRRTQRR